MTKIKRHSGSAADAMPGIPCDRPIQASRSEEDSPMTATPIYRSRFATTVFDVLNPIPYGLFVGTLICDIVYASSRNVFWGKEAAWLVTMGVLFAIIPRLINLCHVWIPSRYPVLGIERLAFLLNLLGIAAAIVNAFVHSRDAYAMVPLNIVLSVITVVLLCIGQIVLASVKVGVREIKVRKVGLRETARE
ncbi:DUF2231 domain-containing protein [Paraburkholderia phymatum]|uniref:DUF2231 domain-containing protein n=1 Tax=Paraburkholderia phymatum TaxID=148447 RepID=A0ACC6UC01_9BURK